VPLPIGRTTLPLGGDVPAEAAASSAPLRTDAPVDESLWSPQRVRAYRESLGREASPALAILRIPKISLEVPVLDGTDDVTLNRAVGRIEGTARIDDEGNLGIAGHRDGFFRRLEEVKVGDTIDLETLSGRKSYRIDRITIVGPDDVSVLDPTPHRAITLVSCYPFWFVGSAPKRYIVRAVPAEEPEARTAAR